MMGSDSVTVVSEAGESGVARVRVGADTLEFNLRPLAQRYADSLHPPAFLPVEQLWIEGGAGGRRSALVVGTMGGRRTGDSVVVGYWSGSLLLGR